jgi:hypothetical protein
MLLFLFVDVLGAVSEPVIVDATTTASVALASSCVKKPGLDATAMEPDVIMSCITPSFGGGFPWEKKSGPRRRAGEMPSCIAASYSGGDGVNLDMPGT